MFEVGKEYKRSSDIHGVYGGQRQGGISTPKSHPFIFLFTSDEGEQHGYKDEFVDGLFWYTGEGQVGDMSMTKGNKAILNHATDKKVIHLFESTRRSYVRYIGAAECLGYSKQLRPDREGETREVIIFQLDINSTPREVYPQYERAPLQIEESRRNEKKSITELKQLALSVPTSNSKEEKARIAYQRADAIKHYALARAKGICEGCEKPAPFMTKKGPYLECHHLYRLADGGPDHPENVIALCTNCHREAHYSKNIKQFNNELSNKVKFKEGK